MAFTTFKIAGSKALDALYLRRELFPKTGDYPFLIGDAESLQRINEAAEFYDQSTAEIIQRSMAVDVDQWLAERREEAAEDEFSAEDMLGTWTGDVPEKGSVNLHRDILTGEIKPEIFLGLATIKEPWQLPAVLKYGAWNACPEAEIHCVFHRKWQTQFGAQIAGLSGDVIECIVTNPPRDQATAIELAWEQYFYCPDIVEQGCESISYLAGTLLNSPYWFFWWD
ncbi:DUF4253 domain-containing protein [Stenomitos frigidus]|uniref:DUF4253 domain-containing protein n=1 Tax=Stenomitos frigidus ULC18 TaxID=2107698 RepID=A0A2T1EID0_9CYAN|nr:DUF4253 domain-containing protein [Stenomitos frigidus]PSB32438.1 hypothetical protein C7B82_05425 [Stenomitos frigidus ULC18]